MLLGTDLGELMQIGAEYLQGCFYGHVLHPGMQLDSQPCYPFQLMWSGLDLCQSPALLLFAGCFGHGV